MKFRKKPVVIEAKQIVDDNSAAEIATWIEDSGSKAEWTESFSPEYGGVETGTPTSVSIHTLEGVMRGDVGDWVIQGVNGEFYPCKPDIFEKTYEPAE